VYVGSSIEWGATAWTAKVTHWLNSQTTGTVTGKTSTFDTSSTWHAARWEKGVLSENPDIIFIATSLHDAMSSRNSGNANSPDAKQTAILLESMIRQTWATKPQTEIVIVDTTGKDYLDSTEIYAAHKAVANYEGVTYISLVDFAEQVLEDDQWSTYFSNTLNPNSDGHTQYAEIVTTALAAKLAAIEETPAQPVNYEAEATTYEGYQVPTSFEFAYKGSEAIKTTGTWNDYTPKSGDGVIQYISGYHTPNEAVEATKGATMTYYFTGNSVMLYGKFLEGSNVTVTLDGNSATTKTIGEKEGGCVYLYDSLTENVTHYVTLTVNGDKAARIAAFASGKTSSTVDPPVIPEDPVVPPVDPPVDPEETTEPNLNNTYYKLTTTKKLNIAYLGGSVTYGMNTPTDCWRTQTRDWFASEYPNATVTGYDKTMSGSSSVWGAARYDQSSSFPQTHVLNNSVEPDLIFLECSINDYYTDNAMNGGKFGAEQSALLMDSMIRRTREKCPKADIIVITVPNATTVNSINDHAVAHKNVADYEGVYYIDLTPVGKSISDKGTTEWNKYYYDAVHPRAAGYRLYTEEIVKNIETWLGKSAEANPTALVDHQNQAATYNNLSVPMSYEMVGRDKVTYNGWDAISAPSKPATGTDRNVRKFVGASGPVLKANRNDATISYTFTGAYTLSMFGWFDLHSDVTVTLTDNDPVYVAKNGATDSENGAAGEVFLYDNLDPTKTYTVTVTVDKVTSDIQSMFAYFGVGKAPVAE
ncbi:MAG: SGNH/GDSL hydrolase family protein, partial [Clostridiales bacterium]|nr:SGNH/GDSL hydrolase family protein [Candidatus Equinaster intestinalis]